MSDGSDTPDVPDPSALARDPEALKSSLERTGRYLKNAGLPFEADEFEEDGPSDTEDRSVPK